MVIVVAEGAGQDLIAESMRSADHQDASGNKLLLDVGLWLSQRIKVDFILRSIKIHLCCFISTHPYCMKQLMCSLQMSTRTDLLDLISEQQIILIGFVNPSCNVGLLLKQTKDGDKS